MSSSPLNSNAIAKPASGLSRALICAVLGVLMAPWAVAQGVQVDGREAATQALARPQVRVSAPVVSGERVVLPGNTPGFAQAVTTPGSGRFPEAISAIIADTEHAPVPLDPLPLDLGPADAGQSTGRISLLLSRSPAQEQALDSYLRALQDPDSPYYGRWLTPTSFGQSFGVADSDLQAVEQWLVSEGFQIEQVPASRSRIVFSGTVGQLNHAFQTGMHSYLLGGRSYLSNTTDPSIPAALAPVVAGVGPLNNLYLKAGESAPWHTTATPVTHSAGDFLHQAPGLATAGNSSALPSYTGTIGGAAGLLVTAADAATIYDAPDPLNRNYSAATTLRNGSGVSIGLVGESDLVLTDYLNYRRLFLGESRPVYPQTVVDGEDPGIVVGYPEVQALTATELAAALAPGATIYFYSSADAYLQSGVEDAAIRAIEDNQVSILSVGLFNCEANLGISGNYGVSELWKQAAAQGITVLVAAGNTGSAGCDASGSAAASGGLAVNGIASTPYNIAVGGTDFDSLSGSFGQYVGSAESADYGSALGYIPESPWNDSIRNDPPGAYSANAAASYGGSTTLSAGGGGLSSAALCAVSAANNICPTGEAAGYAIPSFQVSPAFAATPLATSTVRAVPDVSLFAATGAQHLAAWALCSDSGSNQAGGATYVDCQPSAGSFTVTEASGTTAASAAWAGILAVVSQSLGGARLGQADTVLYDLAASGNGHIFHDVSLGNNAVPCASGTAGCGANGFLTGYNAGAGYDLATGLGSVDITALVSGWSGIRFMHSGVVLEANAGSSVAAPGTAALSIVHGTPVTFSATVTPTSASGSVAVEGPPGAAGSAVAGVIALSHGLGSETQTNLPGGSYTVYGYYGGDASHAPASSAVGIPITVSPEPSQTVVTISELSPANGTQLTNPATAPYGEYGFLYAEPVSASAGTGHGVATGSITLENNGTPVSSTGITNPESLNSRGLAGYALYTLAPGAYSFTAVYPGDASFGASTSSARALTIEHAPTVLSLAGFVQSGAQSGSGSGSGASAGTATVQLSTHSVGAFPTGSFTLTGNGQSYPAQQVTDSYQAGGVVAETATLAIPASNGTPVSFTASYSGDVNYQGSSFSIEQGFTLSGPSSTLSMAPGATGTATIGAASTYGFVGTVTLSCTVSAVASGGTAPTCLLTPAGVALAAGASGSATVNILTAAPSSATASSGRGERPGDLPGDGWGRRPGNGWTGWLPGSGVVVAGVFLWVRPRRRGAFTRSGRLHGRSRLRAGRACVIAAALGLSAAAMAGGLLGCGVVSHIIATTPVAGTTPGTYTLTVTGASGGVSKSVTVKVVVT